MQGITKTARKIDHATSNFIITTFSIQNDGITITKTIGYFLNVIESDGLDSVSFALG